MLHDDVALYEKVLSLSDCVQLQEGLNSILLWAICWQLHLNPSKCEALLISKYHIATHGSLFELLMLSSTIEYMYRLWVYRLSFFTMTGLAKFFMWTVMHSAWIVMHTQLLEHVLDVNCNASM